VNRSAPFLEGEYYHVYTRGVEKRAIFDTVDDWDRFLVSLFLANSSRPILGRNVLRKYQGEPLVNLFDNKRPIEGLVNILAYSLMSNHFHILLQELSRGGVSKFMLKLMTSYSMYFNIKNERSGPLFVRPFRAKHVDLNPLDVQFPGWKEHGISDGAAAQEFLLDYPFSSYRDYAGPTRPQRAILNPDALPIDIRDLEDIGMMFAEYKRGDN
jgi:REP element-mobilizing transposase RayT